QIAEYVSGSRFTASDPSGQSNRITVLVHVWLTNSHAGCMDMLCIGRKFTIFVVSGRSMVSK
ncbi:MAG: hypothetical protein OXE41_11285, partial [Gammaproteobacteria bacterium]|nr:hypothetical protein [Gammaproteobacteria bacterium]